MPHVSEATESGALNLRWADRFVAALAEAGVRDAVLCPGSRSAPLALALARAALRTHVALDERAGAWFALGLAKGSRRPAAVLCTSGTAAANFFPAALEAHHGRVPLILLTADRPPELRDTGAPQTVDQLKLFGDRVRWFVEVGTPGPEPDLLRYVDSLGRRAVATAWGPPAGSVHLNFAFREPLVPSPDAVGTVLEGDDDADAARAPHGLYAPYETAPEPPRGPNAPDETVERIARLLVGKRRGLIVCGPDDGSAGDQEFAEAVAALSAATGYPILADPLSQLRFGRHDRERVLTAYDIFLRAPRFSGRERPEAIVAFGAAPTSKAYDRYAARHPGALHLAVDAAGAWRDPGRRSREVVAADPARFATSLASALARRAEPLPGWWESFARAETAALSAVRRHLDSLGDAITEPGVVRALLKALPDGSILVAGNSMPVRDLDSFGSGMDRAVRVIANRGANGIDGVVSTALGAAAGADAPLLAVVGDLSFHHDLNGLWATRAGAARDGAARATIVIVNNDGGGIFSFLPIAEHGATFERCFATPHGLAFGPACALYGIPYAAPESLSDLASRASASLRERRSLVLEVRTDRAANVALHRAILAEATAAVDREA